MKNQIKKINLNHSLIFFLFCNIFSLITFIINDFTISPLLCLLLILIIGISNVSMCSPGVSPSGNPKYVPSSANAAYNLFGSNWSSDKIIFIYILSPAFNGGWFNIKTFGLPWTPPLAVE